MEKEIHEVALLGVLVCRTRKKVMGHIECPYCGEEHYHVLGDDLTEAEKGLGETVSHCATNAYFLDYMYYRLTDPNKVIMTAREQSNSPHKRTA